MKLKTAITIAGISLSTLLFSGCATTAKYVQHSSNPIKISQKESILIVANDDNLKLAVQNVLINGGYKIKDLDVFKEYYLDTYTGRYINDISNETAAPKYDGASEIVGVVKNGTISGSKSMLNELKEWNDLKDELVRVNDYGRLELEKRDVLHTLYKENGISTIVLIDNNSKGKEFSYTVRAVNSLSEDLLFTMYYTINSEAVKQKKYYERYAKSVNDPESATDAQVVNLGFAKQLAKKMFGGEQW